MFPHRRARPWGQATGATAGVLAGAVLFLLVIPGCVLGWKKNLHYLEVWQKQVVSNERVGPQSNFNIHSYRNQSLANAVFLLSEAAGRSWGQSSKSVPGGPQPGRLGHPISRLAIGVILIGLLAAVVALGKSQRSLDSLTAFGLACCAMVLVSPLAWGHYFMAELPALICVPIWLWRRGMPRAARLAAGVPVVLSWLYYLAMPYTGGLGILGLGTAAWFLAACGVICWAVGSRATEGLAFPSVEMHGSAVSSTPHSLVRGPRIGVGSPLGRRLSPRTRVTPNLRVGASPAYDARE